jgi:hypothetical protein
LGKRSASSRLPSRSIAVARSVSAFGSLLGNPAGVLGR